MCVSATFLLLFVSAANVCRGFNVDTQFPSIFSGPDGSYFGYTVALMKNSNGPVVLVGAPKANSTTLKAKVHEPGALFRCNLSIPITNDSCRELAILKEGNTYTWKGNYYSYRDIKDSMWLGVSLDVRQNTTNNSVVVCGHLWKNKLYSHYHLVNGVCYILNGDLDEVRELLPLIHRNKQGRSTANNMIFHFAFGQAGMSAAFTEDASSMILGAPGIDDWTGSVVNYPINGSNQTADYEDFHTPFSPDEIPFDAYFGYSVTSGRFLNSSTLQYAIGAPRDAKLHGKVYITKSNPTRNIYIEDWKQGSQLGEYFGSTVLGVDLNGDSFAELIVGAPLHSSESEGDEGKVYVYLSDGKNLTKQTEISGDEKPGARFGTAIANLGDINQDGFLDIAVGAPYEEGRGAVYIYHGSRLGLLSRYVQKIEASAVDMKMTGFGIHIARGLDIDFNGYPDMLVGSYSSSQAVLFRSRPVVKVNPRLSLDPNQIAIDVPCENSHRNLSCVQINSCIYYSGAHVPPTLDFKLTLLIRDDRGFFEEGNSSDVKSTMTITVGQKNETCYAFRMYLHKAIKDAINPIKVLMSHELRQPPGKHLKLDEKFPVYDPDSKTSVTSLIPFQTGCNKTDKCYSNLFVIARRSDKNKHSNFITLGEVPSVSIEINARNTGEPAYLSKLYIYLPPSVSAINQDICDSAGQQHNASLVCDIGHPLRNETEINIHIKLDISNLPPQTTYLGIDFKVVTNSTETDLADNNATIPLFFQSVYDIGVTGTSSVEKVMHDGTQPLSAVITHTYIVRNYGPSPLQTVYFNLDVPFQVKTSSGFENIVIFTAVDTEQRTPQSVPVSCDVTHLNIHTPGPTQKQGGIGGGGDVSFDEEIVQVSNAISSTTPVGQPGDRRKRSVEEDGNVTQTAQSDDGEQTSTKTLVIRGNCDNEDFRCITLRCSATSMYHNLNDAGISVSFQVNFTVLDKFLQPGDHLELITKGEISAEAGDVEDQRNVNNVAQVKTEILQEGLPPPAEVESWIYFVSIGVGVLVLLIILILLIKTGFFRRKEKDKMRKLVSESKRETRTDDQAAIKQEAETEGEATI